MKSLRTLIGILCVVVLIGTAGCKKNTKVKVAFVTNNPESFWNIAKVGADKAAAEFDVDLSYKMPSPGNAATQKEIIDSLLARKVKAIAVSVIDPKNQSDYLDEIAGKTALITQDNDAPGSKRLCYIGTNNYEAGRDVGKLVREALGEEGGTVIFFVGQLEALNARQRRQGVIDELFGNTAPSDLVTFKISEDGQTKGKYTILNTYLDQPEGSSKALANAKDAIKTQKFPKTGRVCMVGLWAYNPPQILTAVTDGLKKDRPDDYARVSIVGFDEDLTTLDGIKEGTIYGTVVQNPHQFGYQAVKMMASLAKGDMSVLPKDGVMYIPHRVIAKVGEDKNGLKRISVDEFRPEVEEHLKKKS